jgi:hypothetical protein
MGNILSCCSTVPLNATTDTFLERRFLVTRIPPTLTEITPYTQLDPKLVQRFLTIRLLHPEFDKVIALAFTDDPSVDASEAYELITTNNSLNEETEYEFTLV